MVVFNDFTAGTGNFQGTLVYKLDNVENAFIIHDFSSIKLSDSLYQAPIIFTGTNNTAVLISIIKDNDTKYINVQNYLGNPILEYTLTIQYTKK